MHDLSDPAVHRRVRMLKAGSAQVIVVGFTRIAEPPEHIDGCQIVNLGRTKDGQLLGRIGSVLSVALRLERFESILSDCQMVLARNLEMLFLATRARRRYAPNATLVFECLDIHRLLLGGGFSSRLLRSVETSLMNEVDLIVTSSPRFVCEYFEPRNFNRQIRILENKLLLADHGIERPSRPPASGPPWKIGWFGMLRCRRSFEILSSAAREADGGLEIVIAGRPSPKEFADFERLVRGAPYVKFLGAYRFDDLPALYGDVHFSWAVDYFEQGQNSSWLLPNRIYESSFFGAVPIAAENVETARWLTQRQIGITLVGEPKTALRDVLNTMTYQRYSRLFAAVQNVPTVELADTAESCRQLIDSITKLKISNARDCR